MTKGGIMAIIFFLLIVTGLVYFFIARQETENLTISPTPIATQPPVEEESITTAISITGIVESIAEERVVYKNSIVVILVDSFQYSHQVYIPEITPILDEAGETINAEDLLNATVDMSLIPAEGGYEATKVRVISSTPTPEND